MDNSSGRKNWKHFLFVYTLIFCVLSAVNLLVFFLYGKGLVSIGDGTSQHFTALAYYGQWLRQILGNIFIRHTPAIPEWDFSIGYGSAVIPTLHYYCIGDPLALLSVFFHPENTEILYTILLILRMYLAGLSFGAYCSFMKTDSRGILPGSLSYIFSGYVIFVCFRQPFFLNAFIYFPLILIGVEKIFRKEKPYLFIGMILLSILSNFYFFYMLTLGTILYVLIRYFYSDQKKDARSFFTLLGSFLLYGLIAVMMSAILFLPVVRLFLDGLRTEQSAGKGLFYAPDYYAALISALISPDEIGNWKTYTYLGITVMSLISIFALFGSSKKHRELKTAVVISVIFLLFPIFGSIFNGFNYSCNRWIFLAMFAVSYTLAVIWPDLTRLDDRQLRFVVTGCCVYALLMIFSWTFTRQVKTGGLISLVFLLLAVFILVFGQERAAGVLAVTPKKVYSLLMLLTCINIVINWNYRYSPNKMDYLDYFSQAGTAYSSKAESAANVDPAAAMAGESLVSDRIGKNSINRIEYDALERDLRNSSILFGNRSTQFYWSLANGDICRYILDMSVNANQVFNYGGLDGRAYLDTLAGVRYYVQTKEDSVIPYGFKPAGVTKEDETEQEGPFETEETEVSPADEVPADEAETEVPYIIYENKYTLPLGYTYDCYITHAQYDKLTPVQKQQAISQGILLENYDIADLGGSFNRVNPEYDEEDVPFEITCPKSIARLGDNQFLVTKAGATMTLRFEKTEKNELYLQVSGVKQDLLSNYDLLDVDVEQMKETEWLDPITFESADEDLTEAETESSWEKETEKIITAGDRLDLYRKKFFKKTDNTTTAAFDVSTSKTSQRFLCRFPDDAIYVGQDTYVVNLGYRHNQLGKIRITFPNQGLYTFDDIRVTELPMDSYRQRMKQLAKPSMTDLVIGKDQLSGNIKTEEDTLLCLAVPYDKGWRAYVDKKPAKLLQANTMFMALPLESGTHQIRLVYHTPGLRTGAIITLIGIICFVMLAVGTKIRGRFSD